MKDNTHNDLDELLKRMMMESDEGDAAAEAFWEAQEEAALQGEPEVVPSPEKEKEMVSKLQAEFTPAGSGGGLGKLAGFAGGLVLIGLLSWTVYHFWPQADVAVNTPVADTPVVNKVESNDAPPAESGMIVMNGGVNGAEGNEAGETTNESGDLIASNTSNNNYYDYTPDAPGEESFTAQAKVASTTPTPAADLPPDLEPEKMTLMDQLNAELAAYNEALPAERIYVHTDKAVYRHGETVWFSGYLVNETDMRPSEQSDILQAALINPEGRIVDAINLIAKDGKAGGDFTFSKDMPTGVYTIKAFTNWQRNQPRSLIFQKKVLLQPSVPPQVLLDIAYITQSFMPGDKVEAQINLATLEGEALTKAAFDYSIQLGEMTYYQASGTTDRKGKASLKFTLPKNMDSEKALLNIAVKHDQNIESFYRRLPVTLDSIQFELYPEGGDLVAGLNSRVGFQALNSSGQPVDVAGKVRNQDGKVVASFKSLHDGMGQFNFTPQAGETYRVEINKPVITNTLLVFPEVRQEGMVMSVDRNGKMLVAQINTTRLPDGQAKPQKAVVTVLVRGQMYYQNEVNLNTGSNELLIPTDRMPIGVAQITLFNEAGQPQAERLAFVNQDKQMQVSVSTDKDFYNPTEKVTMTVSVADETGLPVPADLSLSVVDERFAQYHSKQTGNILSKLLLEADITGTVNNPGFYFDENEPLADEALDLLLMTRGWRRFTWKEVLKEGTPQPRYEAKKALVAGIVKDRDNRDALDSVKVTAVEQGKSMYTHSGGQFSIKDLELIVPQTLRFEYHDETYEARITDYNQKLVVLLPGIGYSYNANSELVGIEGRVVDKRNGNPIPIARIYVDKEFYEITTDKNGRFRILLPKGDYRLKVFCSGFETTLIEDIEVEEGLTGLEIALEENLSNISLGAMATTLTPKPVEIYGMVRDETKPFKIEARKGGSTAGYMPPYYFEEEEIYSPYYQIDWVRSAFEEAENREKVENQPVEIKQYPLNDPHTVSNYISTYEAGTQLTNMKDVNSSYQEPKYHVAREFPKLVYSGEKETQAGPYQTTAYWDGKVQTGADGTATVAFYHNGGKGNYKVVVEGVSAGGLVGRQEVHYDTQKGKTLVPSIILGN